MTTSYKPPQKLHEWIRDVAGGELYQLMAFDDRTVCVAVGRFAHLSGSRTCSWTEFLAGSLNATVRDTMGRDTLSEALAFVQGPTVVDRPLLAPNNSFKPTAASQRRLNSGVRRH